MPELGYALFDCDHHYYETRDSFTRYIEPAFRDQAVTQTRNDEGTEIVVVGDRPLTFLYGHDLYDHAGAPGSLKEKLRTCGDPFLLDNLKLLEEGTIIREK